MGREIRKVPPGWEHPKYTHDDAPFRDRVGSYMPMYDKQFETVFSQWLLDFDRVRRGDLTDIERECYPHGLSDWLADEGQPPDRKYYRPYADHERSWFQVYETVSEGTPVTPAFERREDLVTYLVNRGDYWQQKRWAEGDTFMQPHKPGYSREAAEAFVMGDGYAPSLVVISTGAGVTIKEGIEAAAR